MTTSKRRLQAPGQSLIETVVGIIFLIPVVLFLIDMGVIVLGNMANDHFAKQAARAAASTGTAPAALLAVQSVITRTQSENKGFITKCGGEWMVFNGTTQQISGGMGGTPSPPDPGTGFVAVVTSMQIQPPVPFPMLGGAQTFYAKDVEPIVALPAQTSTSSAY